MSAVVLNLSEQASVVVVHGTRFQTPLCCSPVKTAVRLLPTGMSLQAEAEENWPDDVLVAAAFGQGECAVDISVCDTWNVL